MTEVLDPHDMDLVCRYADMLQIGARNMQNYTLLRVAGRTGKPVLLKRGGDVSHHRELAARGRVRAGRR